jgi:hypothetical protein
MGSGTARTHTTRDGFEILDECHRDTLVALETLGELVSRLAVEGDSRRVRDRHGDDYLYPW